MSWRDAKDMYDSDRSTQQERSIAGQLMEAWNRIQALEGQTALAHKLIRELRAELTVHASHSQSTCRLQYD